MAKERCIGQITPSIRETGKTISAKAKGLFGMLVEADMTVTGTTTRRTVMEFSLTLMAPAMTEHGWTDFSTDRVLRLGLMALHITVCIMRARSMDKDITFGLMELSTMVTGT